MTGEEPPQHNSKRLRAFPFVWAAAWPLRQYLAHSPWPRGKGFLTRNVLLPLLPPSPGMFRASLSTGDTLLLQHRESLGLSYLTKGTFESAEMVSLSRCAVPGTFAFDVGANVGIVAIPLARAVGPGGTVVAFEPIDSNASRLRQNLGENGIHNVVVHNAAVADYCGELSIFLAKDAAFHSATEVDHRLATGLSRQVPCLTVDCAWADAGGPDVSVMKIDVEGFELSVLSGATKLIDRCGPAILIEANTETDRQRLADWFAGRGYRCSQPAGFMPWNYLFLPGTENE